jgi:hypothetical protein
MDLDVSGAKREPVGAAQRVSRRVASTADPEDARAVRSQPDGLVATLARIIVAIERRRTLQVVEGGKDMPTSTENRRAR